MNSTAPASAAEQIGGRVKARRTSLGLSRETLATRAGMATDYVDYVESSRGHPSAEVVRRLAEVLHTTVEQLYGHTVLEPPASFIASGEEPPTIIEHHVSAKLSEADCLVLLGSVPVGRVAFAVSGPPLVLPVNFTVMGREVVIQTTPMSQLAEHARAQRLISFEVDNIEEQSHLGWSVLCQGPVRISTEQGPNDHHADELVRPWFAGDRHTVVVLTPTSVSGRRIGLA